MIPSRPLTPAVLESRRAKMKTLPSRTELRKGCYPPPPPSFFYFIFYMIQQRFYLWHTSRNLDQVIASYNTYRSNIFVNELDGVIIVHNHLTISSSRLLEKGLFTYNQTRYNYNKTTNIIGDGKFYVLREVIPRKKKERKSIP